MKKIGSLLLVMCGLILFTACPLETDFPLGEKGKHPIDETLIGTWTTKDTMAVAFSAHVSKGTESNTYLIKVLEPGGAYIGTSDKLTAWLTVIENYTFLIFQDMGADEKLLESFYYYRVQSTSSKVTLSDLDMQIDMNEVADSQAYEAYVRKAILGGVENGLSIDYTKEK